MVEGMSAQDQNTVDQSVTELTDTRLMTQDILTTLERHPALSRGKLREAIRAAGMEGMLRGPELLTLFAPSDEALAGVGEVGRELLSRHVLRGMIKEADLNTTQEVTALSGDTLAVERGDRIKVGGATLDGPEVACTNGVVHPISVVFGL